MTISSYQILNARVSHNATILTVLRFQYAGVIAKTYKARVLTSTSQVMAAFKSVMFDDRQVWPSVSRSDHSLLKELSHSFYFGSVQSYF